MQETIGNKIRIQRLSMNYSQEYMAFMMEMSQSAYSKIERDATVLSIPRIYEIAEILEISPFKLMPHPKYSININHQFILHLFYKIKYLWFSKTKKKKADAGKMGIVHRDKSNAAEN